MTDPLLPNLRNRRCNCSLTMQGECIFPQLEMHYRNRGLQDASGRLPLQRCIRLVSVCRTPLDGLSGWVGGDYHPQDISILCKKMQTRIICTAKQIPLPFHGVSCKDQVIKSQEIFTIEEHLRSQFFIPKILKNTHRQQLCWHHPILVPERLW